MYLMQYIRESQAEYPSISRSPLEVLEHLLFTNGNGIPIIGGNLMVKVQFRRHVSFKEYYREQTTFKELCEQLDYDSENAVEKIFNRLRDSNSFLAELGEGKSTADELWSRALSEFNSRYAKIDSVDNYSLEDLKDPATFTKMLSVSEFNLYMDLHPSYYNQCYFALGTDKDLLGVALALSKALLIELTSILENPKLLLKKKNILGFDRVAEREGVLKVTGTTIPILKEDIRRIEHCLEGCKLIASLRSL